MMLASLTGFHKSVVFPQAFEELETLLAKHNVCIAVKEKLVKDSGVAKDSAYDNIVFKLLTKPRARGEYCHLVLTGNFFFSTGFYSPYVTGNYSPLILRTKTWS
jgi:hypothetical protein